LDEIIKQDVGKANVFLKRLFPESIWVVPRKRRRAKRFMKHRAR